MGRQSLAEAATTAEQEARVQGGGISAWKLVWVALALTFLPPLIGIPIYLKWAAQVPAYTPPQSTWSPTPNGYDQFVAAGEKLDPDDRVQIITSLKPLRSKEVRRLLSTYHGALDQVRTGLRMECRVPFGSTYRRPHTVGHSFYALGRLLAAEGYVEAQQGHYAAAVRHYLDALRFGMAVRRGAGLFEIVDTELHALDGLLLIADRLEPALAGSLLRDLRKLEKEFTSSAEAVLDEKELGTDRLRKLLLQSDPLKLMAEWTSGRPEEVTDVHRWKLRLTPRPRVLSHWRAYMDELAARRRLPFHERKSMPQVPPDPVNQLLLPSAIIGSEFENWDFRDAQMAILETRLAVRLYRHEKGREPSTLKALVPRYLPEIPADPFAPKPLVYRREGPRTLIYSRGPDGDDNGGKPYTPGTGQKTDGDVARSWMPLP